MQAHYQDCLTHFELAGSQLASSLDTLASFAKRHSLNTSSQQRQLQQKFDLAFSEKADILNQLPAAFIPQQAEQYAYLYRTNKSNNWQIHDRPNTISTTPLYQHHSLLNVPAWAVHNQLISKATRLKIADETDTIKTHVIIELVQQLLRSTLTKISDTISLDHTNQPAQIQSILLFANIDHRSDDSLSQYGLEMSSLQADPLNYANKKQNLVASIEGLIQSDLGQWHYFIHTGKECLLQILSTILHWHPITIPPASCWCHYGNHGQNISHRIEKIYGYALKHYINNPDNGELIMSLGERLYQMRWQQGLCDINPLAKKSSLLKHLNKSRDGFYKTAIDPMLDKDALLSTLLEHQSDDKVSLFLLTEHQQINLYIIDNTGCLQKQHFNDLTEATLTNHFHRFLTAIVV